MSVQDRWAGLTKGQRISVVGAIVVCAPIVIAGGISGAMDSGHPKGDPPATTTAAAAAAPGPTFTYPGSPQCAITYRGRGDGSMSWTAVTTVAGQLITHATDKDGGIHRHDSHVGAGPHEFTVDVPIAQITDIGGNLDAAGGKSYGCSVRPAG
jgi:hypothetical protein